MALGLLPAHVPLVPRFALDCLSPGRWLFIAASSPWEPSFCASSQPWGLRPSLRSWGWQQLSYASITWSAMDLPPATFTSIREVSFWAYTAADPNERLTLGAWSFLRMQHTSTCAMAKSTFFAIISNSHCQSRSEFLGGFTLLVKLLGPRPPTTRKGPPTASRSGWRIQSQ